MSTLTLESQSESKRLYRTFFTPQKYEVKPSEQAILDKGTQSRLSFHNGELVLTTWGSDPPAPTVLLMHGWGGSRAQLTGFVEPLLDAGFHVVAYDQPAHGDSECRTTNILEIAESMNLMSQIFGRFDAVIAHSFGTLVTTYSIVVGNFIPPSKLVYFGAFNHLMDTLPRFQAATQLPETLIHPLRRMIDRKLGRDVLRTINHDDLAKHLHIPALIFHDRSDTVTPVEDSRSISQVWKTARYIETDGLGHHGALRSRKIHEQVAYFLK
jgi:pimeloyl-ACP methyl ester carboxylesterase